MQADKLYTARMRLVETGGRVSQDFGMGRIVGQVLVSLYLYPKACPLDDIEESLGLSKASISIAARQLEQLGLVQRVWIKGDRKKYYQSAENIAQALQNGVLTLVRQKVNFFGDELLAASSLLDELEEVGDAEAVFLKQRVGRAQHLQARLNRILGNPLLELLTGGTKR